MMARATRKAVFQAPVLPVAGQRVGVVCGPSEFARDNAGTTICQIQDQWGTHALVMMDSGEVKKCHGLNNGPGVGFHAL